VIPAARPLIGDEERTAVDRVLRSGMIADGPEVAAFEREFADQLVAGQECVAVSSGTAGLHLGLLAAGVGPGDEVIVPSFTFAATANAVALTGATPIFADIVGWAARRGPVFMLRELGPFPGSPPCNSQAWAAEGPHALASLRNLTLGLLRLKNTNSIKETTEWVCRDRTRALQFMTT
jgi:hypothetical protein